MKISGSVSKDYGDFTADDHEVLMNLAKKYPSVRSKVSITFEVDTKEELDEIVGSFADIGADSLYQLL